MQPVTAYDALPGDSRALLDAVVAVGSDLDMRNVLDRIVASSCELTGAEYGALGVLGQDGTLIDLVTCGVDPGTREAIGGLPHGHGILRLLIDHPEPIRLARIQDHPAAHGIPDNHPPMTTFLGVPVRVRGTVFGNLYLTEKAGGAEFTEQDEHLVLALAGAAGTVIENARAYARSERQRAWLEAVSRLHEELEEPTPAEEALHHVVVGARRAVNARAAGVMTPERPGDPEPGGLLTLDGRDTHALARLAREHGSELVKVAHGGEPVAVPLDDHPWRLLAHPMRTRLLGPAALLVLLGPAHTPDGSLDERRLVGSYADQAMLALDRVQAATEREELAVVSDRDRIARDLHDLVIQRLFATGLQLQGTRALASSSEVRERLDGAVEELDTTIRDIRSTIFELQQADPGGVRGGVHRLAGEYSPLLGSAPAVRISGPVEAAVSEEVRLDLEAVLREALSNVAHHSGASTISVEVDVDPDRLRLRVTDDGRGLPVGREESGLRNARRRAEAHGGSLRLLGNDPQGTVLEWAVPLRATRA